MKPLKIVLESVFAEFETGSFQKTVFEVIQVPHNRAYVKTDSRVADREIKSVGSGKLYVGQAADCLRQQVLFMRREGAGETSFLNFAEEKRIAKVCLQICHAVVAHSKNFRHRNAF